MAGAANARRILNWERRSATPRCRSHPARRNATVDTVERDPEHVQLARDQYRSRRDGPPHHGP